MLSKKTVSSVITAALFSVSLSASPAAARGEQYYQQYPVQQQYVDYNGYGSRSYGDRSYDQNDYDRNYDRNSRCKSGNTGMIIGAVAGGLLGRSIAGRYRGRTTGTILGAGAGALAGRALERNSGNRC